MLKWARKHARNERLVQPPDRSVEPCVGYWLDDRNSLKTRHTGHGADRPRSLQNRPRRGGFRLIADTGPVLANE